MKGPFADKALIEWSLITRDKTGDTTTKIKQNSLTLDPIALKADTEYGLILSVTSTDGIKSTAFINASTTKVPLNPSIDPLWDGIPLLLTAKNTTPLVWQLDRGRATENSTLTQTISNAGVHTLSSSQGGIFSLSSIFVTPDNDLDKDGIINALDKCPRLKSQG